MSRQSLRTRQSFEGVAATMRITILLASLDMTGGNRVLSVYAKMLASRGHKVAVFVPRRRAGNWLRRLVTQLRSDGSNTTYLPRRESHFDGTGVPVTELDVLGKLSDADLPDADVVVATWWETAEWVNALSGEKGAKVYLIQHHEVFDYLPVARSRATYKFSLHKVVVAEWLRQVMAEEYGDDDVTLVPNAVDHEMFNAPPRIRQLTPTVGFMYSLTDFKASPLAVEVLRRLKSVLPDLKVISFGHDQPSTLDFMGNDFEFHLLPSQEVIRDCYSRCDVWLSTSVSEGFNLPALEAMACRTPVVSTRTGWPATAIIDGRNGYLAPVGDADALLAGLRKILESDDWNTMSAEAFATAEPLTWDRSCDLLLDTFNRVVEARTLTERIPMRDH
jgi:glycosyltransferase involved in cell wall biosynthesis